jgi:hypothetical protein
MRLVMSRINKKPSSRNNFSEHDESHENSIEYKGNGIRFVVFTAAKFTCQCCGITKRKLTKKSKKLTIHHIHPVEFGGLATEENGFVCCEDCHRAIHRYIAEYEITNNFLEYLKIYLVQKSSTQPITLKRFGIEQQYKKFKKDPNVVVEMFKNVLNKRIDDSDSKQEKAA